LLKKPFFSEGVGENMGPCHVGRIPSFLKTSVLKIFFQYFSRSWFQSV